jgi:hypothetical protein
MSVKLALANWLQHRKAARRKWTKPRVKRLSMDTSLETFFPLCFVPDGAARGRPDLVESMDR